MSRTRPQDLSCRLLLAGVCVAIFSLPGAIRAEDPAAVDALWNKWKAGDKESHEALMDLGPEARSLAPRILKALVDAKPEDIDYDEVEILDAMQADAVPAILKSLEHAVDDDDRKRLIERLELLGPMARGAGDALMRVALGTPTLHEPALRALAAAGVKKDYLISELIRLLSQASPFDPLRASSSPVGPDERADFAVDMLEKCPDERADNPLLQAARFHPNAVVRYSAMRVLVANAAGDPERFANFHILIHEMDDDGQFVGMWGTRVSESAMRGLTSFGHLPEYTSAPLVRKLYRMTFDGRGHRSADVCEAICRCDKLDKDAEALIRNKLRPLAVNEAWIVPDGGIGESEVDAQKRMRVDAASVVLKWKPDDRAVADFLAQIIDERTERSFDGLMGARFPDARAHAARGLGRIGPVARDRLPLLRQVMMREAARKPLTELAFESAWAIAQIDPADEACAIVLKDADSEFQRLHIPWSRVEAVLGKRAALLSDVDEIRDRLKDLSDSKYLFQSQRWHWLKLRPHYPMILPILLEHLRAGDVWSRQMAVEALGNFDSLANVVIPKLVESLRDPRAKIRAAAAEALGKLGPAAAGAIPALEQASRDEYLTVQFHAQDALAAIREPATP